jgi:hypothetical protein
MTKPTISSMEIWNEARRRARNHIRLGLVEAGMKPMKAAKLNIEKKVDELLGEDGSGYIQAAFFKYGIDDD